MNNEERRFHAALAFASILLGAQRTTGTSFCMAEVVEYTDSFLAELDRTKPEEQPEEPQPFRAAFLDLASDGQCRTVKQIREALKLPESSNVGESLRSLQACLAGDETAVVRLRSKASQSRSHSAIWWVEKKG